MSNYPNPVSLTTKISYELPFDGDLSIDIYDMLGRKITTLVDWSIKAGNYNTDLNVLKLQKGVYYYKASLRSTGETFTRSGTIAVEK